MPPNESLSAVIQNMIDEDHARRYAPAEVISISGTDIVVRRLGSSVNEGPYASQAGVAGFVKVGDRVLLRQQAGAIVVEMPVEGAARSNYMTIVGADYDVAQTLSVSAWVELLRVDGLAIPPTGFAICHMTTEANRFGAGTAQMQVRFLINGNPSVAYNVGPTAPFVGQDTTIPLWIGAYSAGFPAVETRIFGFMSGTNISGAAVETITSISLEGRTQDATSGLDQLLATNLLIFA